MLNTKEEALPSSSELATVLLSLVPPIWTAALSPLGGFLGRPPGSSNWPRIQRRQATHLECIVQISSTLPRHPDSFLGPCDAWIESTQLPRQRLPDISLTPFRMWIPTEVQLDLLVTSKSGFLRKRTKVCSEKHFPAALGLITNKEREWFWQEASLRFLCIPTVICQPSIQP